MNLGEVDTVADQARRLAQCQDAAIVDVSAQAWFARVEMVSHLRTDLGIGWTSVPARGDGG